MDRHDHGSLRFLLLLLAATPACGQGDGGGAGEVACTVVDDCAAAVSLTSPCQYPACAQGRCVLKLMAPGSTCDDGDPATADERCGENGSCAPCVPSCEGLWCGDDDGCGGRCTACGENAVCREDGWWCTCIGPMCGDGCCLPGQTCGEGDTCEGEPCTPACDGKGCGDDDGCGGRCKGCAPGASCNVDTWVCDCPGPWCGPSCCEAEQVCGADSTCGTCAPACEGKQCGPDGCGGNCGECDPGTPCNEGVCGCASHHHTTCSADKKTEVWWADSCGKTEDVREQCDDKHCCDEGACWMTECKCKCTCTGGGLSLTVSGCNSECDEACDSACSITGSGKKISGTGPCTRTCAGLSCEG